MPVGSRNPRFASDRPIAYGVPGSDPSRSFEASFPSGAA